eukprot:EC816107.1.p3 GENE.EC816107.1~~EC816107.1.p3  ORF type:complete len:80 (+),score=8.71 EC816107.1:78-317(+)
MASPILCLRLLCLRVRVFAAVVVVVVATCVGGAAACLPAARAWCGVVCVLLRQCRVACRKTLLFRVCTLFPPPKNSFLL